MLMSPQQQIAIIDEINEHNHPSFQFVGLNEMGRRTFLRDVPILLLPRLLEHSPNSRLWASPPARFGNMLRNHTSDSTRMSVLFCHLRDNLTGLLEMRVTPSGRRRQRS
jgi:hypothetical protein